MDPKSNAKQQPAPLRRESTDLHAETWEPPFDRWERLTEVLISRAGRMSDSVALPQGQTDACIPADCQKSRALFRALRA